MIEKLKYILLMSLLVFGSISTFGQIDSDQHDLTFTMPEIALVDIEPNTSVISLTFEPPVEAGLPLMVDKVSSNNDKWLNYSVSLSPSATQKNITAQLSSGVLPDGISLQLLCGLYNGNGAGSFGNPAGLITLSNIPQIIINGIGASFTGDGANNGHQLIFSLSIDQYAQLDADESGTVEVIFTITD